MTIRVSFEESGEDFVCFKEMTHSHRPERNLIEEYHPTAGRYLPEPPSPEPPILDIVEVEPFDFEFDVNVDMAP
ncbi:hypothetical protein SISSUDRAFT_1052643 [Sistotremastrum suecicum HHB10207 ss-3]|uniref:Uncharacterized protein n=1 Tax=Sistotremastrum suecicum HHB10207 ss-3 TaxID=1314776 RepID=A0A165ZR20_9AGAM|nr:hypothetical protein SISSUDRAFT_1052643 [Sistotremastrum suecicum HHB10207 ss-3]